MSHVTNEGGGVCVVGIDVGKEDYVLWMDVAGAFFVLSSIYSFLFFASSSLSSIHPFSPWLLHESYHFYFRFCIGSFASIAMRHLGAMFYIGGRKKSNSIIWIAHYHMHRFHTFAAWKCMARLLPQ